MIVECESCHTKFKLADEKVTAKGVKIRCTKCKHVFVVRKEEAAAQSGFSVADFGAGAEEGDATASDFDFADKPLGKTPGAAPPSKPDRPMRPAPGQAPPPRPVQKSEMPDHVFAGSSGKKDTEPNFDNLDELFGSDKPALPPPPLRPPPAERTAPRAPAPEPGNDSDPFGDAMTLDTGAGGLELDNGPPPGGAFDAPLETDDSPKSGGGVEFDFGASEGPDVEKSEQNEKFDSVLSSGGAPDDFFSGGSAAEVQSAKGQSADDQIMDPGIQWGPKKTTASEKGGIGGILAFIGIVLVILLAIAWRASIEFAPELYFNAGMSYDDVVSMREGVPFFVTNENFPKPPKFWEIQITQTYTITNQFEKELFVAEGQLTNIGPGKRGFFQLEAKALDAEGNPVGSIEKIAAGNQLDVEALKRSPVAKVRVELNRRVGQDGINAEVAQGASIPFQFIFVGWETPPASIEIVSVDAVKLGN